MKTITLLYHDAVRENNFNESGFSGAGSSVYKLDICDMKRHFEEIAASMNIKPSSIYNFIEDANNSKIPFFLTFDDGGVSSATYISDLLEQFGWIGHFFITAGYIDTSAFVSSKQIRELRKQGHIIGSHSWSHPTRMSRCNWSQIQNEWSESIKKLSDITGEKINIASVPGGYFSVDVAKAASYCGIRVLFTSEPVKTVYRVDECLVLGRYTIPRGTAPNVARTLASDRTSFHQMKQYFVWNTKKIVKLIGGKNYLIFREHILKSKANN